MTLVQVMHLARSHLGIEVGELAAGRFAHLRQCIHAGHKTEALARRIPMNEVIKALITRAQELTQT